MKSLALLTTMAAAAAVGAVSTTLRGAALAQQQEPPSGVEEVGEQIEHYPPPNWDGMHAPSRRVLMERQLEGTMDDAQEEDEVHDPFGGMLVVGNLIEDVENDTGLYDWEEDDERKDDKSYEPPVDSVTVSPSRPHRTKNVPCSRSYALSRLPIMHFSQPILSPYPIPPPPPLYAPNHHVSISSAQSCIDRPPAYATSIRSSRGTIFRAMSTTVARAMPPARTLRER